MGCANSNDSSTAGSGSDDRARQQRNNEGTLPSAQHTTRRRSNSFQQQQEGSTTLRSVVPIPVAAGGGTGTVGSTNSNSHIGTRNGTNITAGSILMHNPTLTKSGTSSTSGGSPAKRTSLNSSRDDGNIGVTFEAALGERGGEATTLLYTSVSTMSISPPAQSLYPYSYSPGSNNTDNHQHHHSSVSRDQQHHHSSVSRDQQHHHSSVSRDQQHHHSYDYNPVVSEGSQASARNQMPLVFQVSGSFAAASNSTCNNHNNGIEQDGSLVGHPAHESSMSARWRLLGDGTASVDDMPSPDCHHRFPHHSSFGGGGVQHHIPSLALFSDEDEEEQHTRDESETGTVIVPMHRASSSSLNPLTAFARLSVSVDENSGISGNGSCPEGGDERTRFFAARGTHHQNPRHGADGAGGDDENSEESSWAILDYLVPSEVDVNPLTTSLSQLTRARSVASLERSLSLLPPLGVPERSTVISLPDAGIYLPMIVEILHQMELLLRELNHASGSSTNTSGSSDAPQHHHVPGEFPEQLSSIVSVCCGCGTSGLVGLTLSEGDTMEELLHRLAAYPFLYLADNESGAAKTGKVGESTSSSLAHRQTTNYTKTQKELVCQALFHGQKFLQSKGGYYSGGEHATLLSCLFRHGAFYVTRCLIPLLVCDDNESKNGACPTQGDDEKKNVHRVDWHCHVPRWKMAALSCPHHETPPAGNSPEEEEEEEPLPPSTTAGAAVLHPNNTGSTSTTDATIRYSFPLEDDTEGSLNSSPRGSPRHQPPFKEEEEKEQQQQWVTGFAGGDPTPFVATLRPTPTFLCILSIGDEMSVSVDGPQPQGTKPAATPAVPPPPSEVLLHTQFGHNRIRITIPKPALPTAIASSEVPVTTATIDERYRLLREAGKDYFTKNRFLFATVLESMLTKGPGRVFCRTDAPSHPLFL